MMICCGMAVKRMGMLGVSMRKMKALTVKKDRDTNWLRQNLTCFVYQVYEINSKIFVLR
jgi:hypothetical protein